MDGIEKCLSKANEGAANRHSGSTVVVPTSIASVAGPSTAKVIIQGTAVSVATPIDTSFPAICPGLVPKDTALYV